MLDGETPAGRDGLPATPTLLEPFPRQGFAADVIDGLIETYIKLGLFYTYSLIEIETLFFLYSLRPQKKAIIGSMSVKLTQI